MNKQSFSLRGAAETIKNKLDTHFTEKKTAEMKEQLFRQHAQKSFDAWTKGKRSFNPAFESKPDNLKYQQLIKEAKEKYKHL